MNEKSISDVVKIDQQGITFSDNTKILFSECVDNFQIQYPGSNSKCVAQRDITSKPPYFEFYTSPVRFKIAFDYKCVFSKSKNKNSFNNLYFQILSFGFTTYDLS